MRSLEIHENEAEAETAAGHPVGSDRAFVEENRVAHYRQAQPGTAHGL